MLRLSALAQPDDDLLAVLGQSIQDEEAAYAAMAQQQLEEDENGLEGLGDEDGETVLGDPLETLEDGDPDGNGQPAQQLDPIGERWESPPEKGPAEPQPGDVELQAEGVPGLTVICGKVIEEVSKFPDNYFDAIFGDPPYLLEFMGRPFDKQHKTKQGDNDGQRMQAFHEEWIKACLPKLKPGGNFVAASGSRVYHRLACAAEDAGLELLPMVVHAHGEAMAQGAAIDKLIDKAAGAERELVGRRSKTDQTVFSGADQGGWKNDWDITAPATPAAKLWEGYATRIKDALGPWVMARKPFEGPSYRNALEHGVAGFNVDRCRVATEDDLTAPKAPRVAMAYGEPSAHRNDGSPLGRYPSNVAFQHSEACTADACAPGCAVADLDQQSGHLKSHGGGRRLSREGRAASYGDHKAMEPRAIKKGDEGAASRFYKQFCYQAKAGPGERMRGCESFFWKVDRANPLGFERITREEWNELDERYQGSIHPTLKPIELCRYLAKLILPPPREDGEPRRVLIPFAGTFSEAIGAFLAGWDEVVAIEMEPVYVEIGKARAPIWVATD